MGNRRRLSVALGITLAILGAEVAGALVSGSLALLADAGHMLTDAGALGLSVLAAWFAARPATQQRTYGHYRVEILTAAVNAAVLLVVGTYVVIEAVRRLVTPPPVSGGVMIVFAAVALLGNALSYVVLRGGSRHHINVRSASVEVLADLLAAAGVLVAALVIMTTGFTRADAIASAVIGAVILPRTWWLLREATDVLLESTPKGIDLADVRRHILDVPGVIDAHDLHVWALTSGLNVLSVHVVKTAEADAGQVLDRLCECLADHFDIEHSTFQLELPQHREHEAPLHG